MQVGCIGAGAANTAAAYLLDDAVPEAELTILEKSGGVSGRAATRRHEGRYYEYGANYLKDDDERVVELITKHLDTEGLVQIEKPVYVFDESGAVSDGRDATERKWSYRTGLTQIAKRLLARTDASVQLRTRVETIRRDDDQWWLRDTGGSQWGPFDLVLCNPPAPQTAALLKGADWNSELRTTLSEAVQAVPYRTVYTGVLGYTFELDRPYYGLVNPGKDHEIGWLSREECKPGHVPDGETVLIVQASHEWSVEHYDENPEANVAELARMAADIVGDPRLADPVWTDHQGWRYALPEGRARRGPLDAAEREGLYCLGDWVAGAGRLHAALRNGLETGERIARRS